MSTAAVLNRVAAATLALAVVLVSLWGLVEIALAQSGRSHWLLDVDEVHDWLRSNPWSDALVVVTAAALVVLGLGLIVLGLRRGRPGEVAMASSAEAVTVAASRRSIDRALVFAAERQDGVQDASAKTRRRSARVVARTPLSNTGEVKQRVTAAVRERLDDLALASRRRVRVKMKRTR
jgi:hypothetical protein